MKEIEEMHKKILEKLEEASKITADEDEGNIIYVKERSGIKSRIEDVIDSYNLLSRRRNHLVELYPNYLKRYLMVALLFVKQLWPKLKIANTIVKIKEDMNLLSQSRHQAVEAANDPRSLFRFTDDESLFVDIQRRKEQIITELNLQDTRHLKRSFLAVRGDAGIGKTTVVNQVYEEVKSQFTLRAWVTVSQSYEPADILLKILQKFQVPENVQHDVKISQDILSASEVFRNYMVQKNLSYIVVLDDVWDYDLLNNIRVALPSDQNGSRILMTTRNKKVAEDWKYAFINGNVYVAERLSEEYAWELFCKRLFNNNNYPDRALEEVSREILAKCAGIPLVILAVAGLLVNKETIAEWKTVRDHLGHEYKTSPTYADTKKIMLYSYHDLPPNLKACFLYFGMFPEDHDIEVSKLVRAWVAEALAKSDGSYTPEEVAENYVNNLIERGLVMRISHNMKNITIFLPTESELFESSVRIHDVLHEIIREKSKELDFCEFLLENSQEIDKNGKPRRLSINSISKSLNLQDIRTRWDNACSIRSLLLNKCTNCGNLLKEILPQFADMLRVLHLEESEIDGQIPHEVANLQNLRLLRLCIRNIQNLPTLVCQLINLETLDIYNRSINKPVALPTDIKGLQNLKHLIVSRAVIIPVGVLTSLTELQTLVEVNVSESGLVKELKDLKRMRTLHVFKLDGQCVPAFCDALQGMTELRSLQVWVRHDTHSSAIDFEPEHLIDSPPQKLEELVLIANLTDRLPTWIPELHSLVCMSFEICIDMDYLNTLQVLGDLPSDSF
ncbi:disease resistance protein RPM1 [Beta vulgaris subsp. vulgaris]|uniref:disease resistance protein RPM1 n=1 Tax=Beta vulgaris subsp. vulgaris TaxID=3555 RepID=UPI002036C66F|nr:disease resistance protein RPM1 [Beta vulgaris subsp. vulgaris]